MINRPFLWPFDQKCLSFHMNYPFYVLFNLHTKSISPWCEYCENVKWNFNLFLCKYYDEMWFKYFYIQLIEWARMNFIKHILSINKNFAHSLDIRVKWWTMINDLIMYFQQFYPPHRIHASNNTIVNELMIFTYTRTIYIFSMNFELTLFSSLSLAQLFFNETRVKRKNHQINA